MIRWCVLALSVLLFFTSLPNSLTRGLVLQAERTVFGLRATLIMLQHLSAAPDVRLEALRTLHTLLEATPAGSLGVSGEVQTTSKRAQTTALTEVAQRLARLTSSATRGEEGAQAAACVLALANAQGSSDAALLLAAALSQLGDDAPPRAVFDVIVAQGPLWAAAALNLTRGSRVEVFWPLDQVWCALALFLRSISVQPLARCSPTARAWCRNARCAGMRVPLPLWMTRAPRWIMMKAREDSFCAAALRLPWHRTDAQMPLPCAGDRYDHDLAHEQVRLLPAVEGVTVARAEVQRIEAERKAKEEAVSAAKAETARFEVERTEAERKARSDTSSFVTGHKAAGLLLQHKVVKILKPPTLSPVIVEAFASVLRSLSEDEEGAVPALKATLKLLELSVQRQGSSCEPTLEHLQHTICRLLSRPETAVAAAVVLAAAPQLLGTNVATVAKLATSQLTASRTAAQRDAALFICGAVARARPSELTDAAVFGDTQALLAALLADAATRGAPEAAATSPADMSSTAGPILTWHWSDVSRPGGMLRDQHRLVVKDDNSRAQWISARGSAPSVCVTGPPAVGPPVQTWRLLIESLGTEAERLAVGVCDPRTYDASDFRKVKQRSFLWVNDGSHRGDGSTDGDLPRRSETFSWAKRAGYSLPTFRANDILCLTLDLPQKTLTLVRECRDASHAAHVPGDYDNLDDSNEDAPCRRADGAVVTVIKNVATGAGGLVPVVCIEAAGGAVRLLEVTTGASGAVLSPAAVPEALLHAIAAAAATVLQTIAGGNDRSEAVAACTNAGIVIALLLDRVKRAMALPQVALQHFLVAEACDAATLLLQRLAHTGIGDAAMALTSDDIGPPILPLALDLAQQMSSATTPLLKLKAISLSAAAGDAIAALCAAADADVKSQPCGALNAWRRSKFFAAPPARDLAAAAALLRAAAAEGSQQVAFLDAVNSAWLAPAASIHYCEPLSIARRAAHRALAATVTRWMAGPDAARCRAAQDVVLLVCAPAERAAGEERAAALAALIARATAIWCFDVEGEHDVLSLLKAVALEDSDPASLVAAACDGVKLRSACDSGLRALAAALRAAPMPQATQVAVPAEPARAWWNCEVAPSIAFKLFHHGRREINGVCLTPDGSTVLTVGDDKSLMSCDATSASPRWPAVRASSRFVLCLAVSPDGSTIFTGSCDGTVKAWRSSDRSQGATFDGHRNHVTAVAVAEMATADADTSTLLLLTCSRDTTLKLWDVASPSDSLREFIGHLSAVFDCCFSSGGRLAASASVDDARVWNVGTGECLHVLQHDLAMACRFVDGMYAAGPALVTAGGDSIRIWRTDVGSCSWTMDGRSWSNIISLAVCHASTVPEPNDAADTTTGALIAVGTTHSEVRIFEARGGHTIPIKATKTMRLDKEPAAVRALTFSSNGDMLFAVGRGLTALRPTKTPSTSAEFDSSDAATVALGTSLASLASCSGNSDSLRDLAVALARRAGRAPSASILLAAMVLHPSMAHAVRSASAQALGADLDVLSSSPLLVASLLSRCLDGDTPPISYAGGDEQTVTAAVDAALRVLSSSGKQSVALQLLDTIDAALACDYGGTVASQLATPRWRSCLWSLVCGTRDGPDSAAAHVRVLAVRLLAACDSEAAAETLLRVVSETSPERKLLPATAAPTSAAATTPTMPKITGWDASFLAHGVEVGPSDPWIVRRDGAPLRLDDEPHNVHVRAAPCHGFSHGAHYFEVIFCSHTHCTGEDGEELRSFVGVVQSGCALQSETHMYRMGRSDFAIACDSRTWSGVCRRRREIGSNGMPASSGDTIGVYVDTDAGAVIFYRNGAPLPKFFEAKPRWVSKVVQRPPSPLLPAIDLGAVPNCAFRLDMHPPLPASMPEDCRLRVQACRDGAQSAGNGDVATRREALRLLWASAFTDRQANAVTALAPGLDAVAQLCGEAAVDDESARSLLGTALQALALLGGAVDCTHIMPTENILPDNDDDAGGNVSGLHSLLQKAGCTDKLVHLACNVLRVSRSASVTTALIGEGNKPDETLLLMLRARLAKVLWAVAGAEEGVALLVSCASTQNQFELLRSLATLAQEATQAPVRATVPVLGRRALALCEVSGIASAGAENASKLQPATPFATGGSYEFGSPAPPPMISFFFGGAILPPTGPSNCLQNEAYEWPHSADSLSARAALSELAIVEQALGAGYTRLALLRILSVSAEARAALGPQALIDAMRPLFAEPLPPHQDLSLMEAPALPRRVLPANVSCSRRRAGAALRAFFRDTLDTTLRAIGIVICRALDAAIVPCNAAASDASEALLVKYPGTESRLADWLLASAVVYLGDSGVACADALGPAREKLSIYMRRSSLLPNVALPEVVQLRWLRWLLQPASVAPELVLNIYNDATRVLSTESKAAQENDFASPLTNGNAERRGMPGTHAFPSPLLRELLAAVVRLRPPPLAPPPTVSTAASPFSMSGTGATGSESPSREELRLAGEVENAPGPLFGAAGTPLPSFIFGAPTQNVPGSSLSFGSGPLPFGGQGFWSAESQFRDTADEEPCAALASFRVLASSLKSFSENAPVPDDLLARVLSRKPFADGRLEWDPSSMDNPAWSAVTDAELLRYASEVLLAEHRGEGERNGDAAAVLDDEDPFDLFPQGTAELQNRALDRILSHRLPSGGSEGTSVTASSLSPTSSVLPGKSVQLGGAVSSSFSGPVAAAAAAAAARQGDETPLCRRSASALAGRLTVLQALSAALREGVEMKSRPAAGIFGFGAAPTTCQSMPLICMFHPIDSAFGPPALLGAFGTQPQPVPPRATETSWGDNLAAPAVRHLRAVAGRLLPSLRGSLLARGLCSTALPQTGALSGPPEVSIDRGAALVANERKQAGDARLTVYGQLAGRLPSNFAVRHDGGYRHRGAPLWRVKLLGEGATDMGGPFRETLTQAIDELMNAAFDDADQAAGPFSEDSRLLLLDATPNARHAGEHVAPHTDCAQPIHGVSLTAFQRDGLIFLGRLMGAALRTGNLLPLRMPPITWRLLQGAKLSSMGLSDLATVDVASAAALQHLLDIPDEGGWPPALTWHIKSPHTGVSIPLLRGAHASREMVHFTSRREYVAAALYALLNDNRAAMSFLHEGLHSCVPPACLAMLTWRDLEQRVCGLANWSVDELKARTNVDVASSSVERAAVDAFWAAMETFTATQRAAVLAFGTGRSRLPRAGAPGESLHLEVLSGEPEESPLPQASTCSSTLRIPRLPDTDAMAHALLVACQWSGAIDADAFGLDGRLFQLLDARRAHFPTSHSTTNLTADSTTAGWQLHPLFAVTHQVDMEDEEQVGQAANHLAHATFIDSDGEEERGVDEDDEEAEREVSESSVPESSDDDYV